MMSLAKCVFKDLSVEVLEYPDITMPEQGLKRKDQTRSRILGSDCLTKYAQILSERGSWEKLRKQAPTAYGSDWMPPKCLPACLLNCLLACLPACLLACLLACLPACLRSCLLACLPAYLLACLPACLPACLLACLLACLPACLLAWPTWTL